MGGGKTTSQPAARAGIESEKKNLNLKRDQKSRGNSVLFPSHFQEVKRLRLSLGFPIKFTVAVFKCISLFVASSTHKVLKWKQHFQELWVQRRHLDFSFLLQTQTHKVSPQVGLQV